MILAMAMGYTVGRSAMGMGKGKSYGAVGVRRLLALERQKPILSEKRLRNKYGEYYGFLYTKVL